jgi:hypothetical protein
MEFCGVEQRRKCMIREIRLHDLEMTRTTIIELFRHYTQYP